MYVNTLSHKKYIIVTLNFKRCTVFLMAANFEIP